MLASKILSIHLVTYICLHLSTSLFISLKPLDLICLSIYLISVGCTPTSEQTICNASVNDREGTLFRHICHHLSPIPSISLNFDDIRNPSESTNHAKTRVWPMWRISIIHITWCHPQHGGFLSHRGTPSPASILDGDFPWTKPSSCWGTPMTSWKAPHDHASEVLHLEPSNAFQSRDQAALASGHGCQILLGWIPKKDASKCVFNRFEYDMTIVYTYTYIYTLIYIIHTQYDYYRSQMKLKHEAHRGDVDPQWAISAVESQRHPPTPRQKFPSLSEQSRRAGKPKPTISPSLKLGRYEKNTAKQCKTCSCRGHVVVVVDRRTSKNDEPTRISASCSVSSRPSCK